MNIYFFQSDQKLSEHRNSLGAVGSFSRDFEQCISLHISSKQLFHFINFNIKINVNKVIGIPEDWDDIIEH